MSVIIRKYALVFSVIFILYMLVSAGHCIFARNSLSRNYPSSGQTKIMDHRFTDASKIPEEWILAAKKGLHIAYQHTSHGSQIISGMNALAGYPPSRNRYQWTDNGRAGLDLDYYDPIMAGYHDLSTEDSEDASGNTPWANATRKFLDNQLNTHVNVIMWSWCRISGHNIDRYIANMEKLIAEYGPGGSNPRSKKYPVEFVFMTGHSEGDGEDGFAAQAARKIRAHCEKRDRWLIDYYDIESHDPDGKNYGNKNVRDNLSFDGGNWSAMYLESRKKTDLYSLVMGTGKFKGCPSCAHSDSPPEAALNCILKAQAAWQLFARIAGWEGN